MYVCLFFSTNYVQMYKLYVQITLLHSSPVAFHHTTYRYTSYDVRLRVVHHTSSTGTSYNTKIHYDVPVRRTVLIVHQPSLIIIFIQQQQQQQSVRSCCCWQTADNIPVSAVQGTKLQCRQQGAAVCSFFHQKTGTGTLLGGAEDRGRSNSRE